MKAFIDNSTFFLALLAILIVSFITWPAAITGVSKNLSSIYLAPTFSELSSSGITLFIKLIIYSVNGNNNTVFATLNTVWAFAICLLTSSGLINWTILAINHKNGKNTSVPTRLKIKCKKAALCAILLVPILASTAVTHVPILHPNIIGKARFISITPVVANTINIPVVAEELCSKAVIAAPAIIPIKQLPPTATKKSENIGDDANGFIAPLIKLIPLNNIPKPRRIFPNSLLFLALANIINAVPANMNNGAISSNLNATNCAVIVVPILAPIITPAACARLISPAFTKPTTITVVALLLWITAVTMAPIPTPNKRLLVTFSRIRFSPSPAAFSNPSPINFIP